MSKVADRRGAKPRGEAKANPKPGTPYPDDAPLSNFAHNVDVIEEKLDVIIAELGAANPSDSRLDIYLRELLSIGEEAGEQQRLASQDGTAAQTLRRLNIILGRKVPSAVKSANALKAQRSISAPSGLGGAAAAIEPAPLSPDVQEALSNFNAAIEEVGKHYDNELAALKAQYRAGINVEAAQAGTQDQRSSDVPALPEVDTDPLKDEDENMNTPSREEFNATILASEARMETRVVRIEGSINTYMARAEGIENSILLLSQQAAKAAQDAAQSAQQATGIKTTLWITSLTTILSILAIAISTYLATQSSNIGIVQATLAAFESGKSQGEKSAPIPIPAPAAQAPSASKGAK